MKLPEELITKIMQLPCWPSNHEVQDLDAIELIVRYCAQVCEDLAPGSPGPVSATLECERAILAAFGLEDTP